MGDSSERVIVVGQIAGAHGVKGWVKVLSFTDPRGNLFDYSPWFLKEAGAWVEYENIHGRAQGKGWIAKIPGCDDRDATRQYRNVEIAIKREQLPPTDDDEYYWTDLIGLSVLTEQQIKLGLITQMFATGANDVMVVEDQDKQRLIPFLMNQVVKQVDLGSAQIVVDWDPDF